MTPKLRFALIPILATTLLLAPVKPAAASQVDTTFNDIFGIFRQAFEDVRAYVEQTITGVMDALPGELDGVIHNAVGDLGLVDPNLVRSDIAEELAATLTGDLAQSDTVQAAAETANKSTGSSPAPKWMRC